MARGGNRATVPPGERSAPAPAVSVALPLPIHSEFTYTVRGPVPPPGTRVLVPFQKGERIGWVAVSYTHLTLPTKRIV